MRAVEWGRKGTLFTKSIRESLRNRAKYRCVCGGLVWECRCRRTRKDYLDWLYGTAVKLREELGEDI